LCVCVFLFVLSLFSLSRGSHADLPPFSLS
jgi:hypothetical protein